MELAPELKLSLVVPTYNGERYIEQNVRTIVSELESLGDDFEILVVCDGSTDNTTEAAARVDDPRVHVLSYPDNGGKGHAITHGVAEARGRLIGWLDSDLDIPPSVILDFVRRIDRSRETDAVVGSKRHRESNVVYSPLRRIYSWGYQMFTWTLFRVNCRDTQVGAKVFRREMLDTVCPLLLVKRYAFDLEVLAVGAEFGFDRIDEGPVVIRDRFSGTSIDWRAVREMLTDTLAIAYRIHLRHHYVRRFAALQRERIDSEQSTPAFAEVR
ncbi:MAG: glycosyltransferase family 2 protein [Actinobacteria bacterium]|nr:glycosyltransferase family 2 protein [Actinomycetota bacterium]